MSHPHLVPTRPQSRRTVPMSADVDAAWEALYDDIRACLGNTANAATHAADHRPRIEAAIRAEDDWHCCDDRSCHHYIHRAISQGMSGDVEAAWSYDDLTAAQKSAALMSLITERERSGE